MVAVGNFTAFLGKLLCAGKQGAGGEGGAWQLIRACDGERSINYHHGKQVQNVIYHIFR